MAKSDHPPLPGQGRGHRRLRPGDPGRHGSGEAPLGASPAPSRPYETLLRRRAVLPRERLRPRRAHLPVLRATRFPPSQLTFDHVVPVARGGRKDWDNIVTCCIPCNRRKGDLLPEQAGLRLVRRPRRPPSLPAPHPEPRRPPHARQLARLPLLGPLLGRELTLSPALNHEPPRRPADDGPARRPAVDRLGPQDGHPARRAALRPEAHHPARGEHLLVLVERPPRVARPVPDPPPARHRGAALPRAAGPGGEGPAPRLDPRRGRRPRPRTT